LPEQAGKLGQRIASVYFLAWLGRALIRIIGAIRS
jgi:hypothetical protein